MKRILVVDDDASSIEIFKTILEGLSYVVHAITNPELAIETIRIMYPDLIMLDWCMPQKDGIEVLKTIKCNKEYRNIPVILSTGVRTSPNEMKMALEAGAMDFIRKPVDEIELEARIASAFRIIHYHQKNIELAIKLKNEQLENEEMKRTMLETQLYKKEQEIKLTAIALHQNKDFVSHLKEELEASNIEFAPQQRQYLFQLINKYIKITNSDDWNFFSQQFTELNAPFYANINAVAPDLTWGELRLCALLKIGLSLKEITAVNNSNYAAVKKALYRIRRKLNINEEEDIHFFLQKF
jgi:DNA-binding response OmpR family regulator